MNSPEEVLETYVRAKDLNCPGLIFECFAPEAVLTFSLGTDSIWFPAQVTGSQAIAKTLVTDFGERFTRCKTYYVSDSTTFRSRQIDRLPWLVIMRERSRSALRLGKGFYRWQLESDGKRLRVHAMHIYIDRMDMIDDEDGKRLERLQTELPYPWLSPATLAERFASMSSQTPDLAFLDAFRTPVAHPQ